MNDSSDSQDIDMVDNNEQNDPPQDSKQEENSLLAKNEQQQSIADPTKRKLSLSQARKTFMNNFIRWASMPALMPLRLVRTGLSKISHFLLTAITEFGAPPAKLLIGVLGVALSAVDTFASNPLLELFGLSEKVISPNPASRFVGRALKELFQLTVLVTSVAYLAVSKAFNAARLAIKAVIGVALIIPAFLVSVIWMDLVKSNKGTQELALEETEKFGLDLSYKGNTVSSTANTSEILKGLQQYKLSPAGDEWYDNGKLVGSMRTQGDNYDNNGNDRFVTACIGLFAVSDTVSNKVNAGVDKNNLLSNSPQSTLHLNHSQV